MRKLATIRTISDLLPIEGKDLIELAIVDGWSVIVKKDEFKIGGLCIYCEIDSVMPARPEFEFLRKKDYRIKTMKMAGVISQGICFSPAVFGWEEDAGSIIIPDKKGHFTSPNSKLVTVGADVTDILGITQYARTMDKDPTEQPVVPSKFPKFLMKFKWFRQLVYKKDHREGKGFPKFVSKTDESRIQNLPHILKVKCPWVVTEKLDGCSCTYALTRKKFLWMTRYEFIVCSRNLRIWTESNDNYWKVAKKFKIEQALKNLIGNSDWIAIQGECLAPNVQGNKYKVKDVDFYAFNLITTTGRVGSMVAREVLAVQNIKFVPILERANYLPETVPEVLEYAHGKSAIEPSTLREGLVFRSEDGKTSFKAVDPLFLIKYDE